MILSWISGFAFSQLYDSYHSVDGFISISIILLLLPPSSLKGFILGYIWHLTSTFPLGESGFAKIIAQPSGITIVLQNHEIKKTLGKGIPGSIVPVFHANNRILNIPRIQENHFTNHSSSNDKHMQWRKTLILGEKSLQKKFKQQFVESGLIHLMCISGFHVHILFKISFYFWIIICRVFYILQIISYKKFDQWTSMLDALSLTTIAFYCCKTGWEPPAQRAFIFITLEQFFHKGIAYNKLPLCAAIQIFCFPNCFITPSNLLSWIIFILISSPTGNSKLIRHLRIHIGILTTSLIFLGSFHLISIFSNTLVPSFFPFIYLSALIGIFWNNSLSLVIEEIFFKYIEITATFTEQHPCFSISVDNITLELKILIIITLCGILFIPSQNTCKWNNSNS